MYLQAPDRLGQPSLPITSGPAFDAERAAVEQERRRWEAARQLHAQRLAPRPLATLPLLVLKPAGVRSTTRVGKNTASLLHDALERSRVLRPYIARKLSRIRIPKGFVHHDTDAGFEAAYVRLHNLVIPFGSQQERELRTKRGFFHPQTDSIHLRPTASVGYALHEAIHKFAERGFRPVLGGYLDEGLTQYFTDRVLVEQELGRMTRHLYEPQLRCAQHFVRLFTPDLAARAYFEGGNYLTQLAREVLRRLNLNAAGLPPLRQGDALCRRLSSLQP
jgi:hypothetical protein